MSSPQRYLVGFGPKQTPHFFTDILVIGAGIAGLRAALEVPPDLSVLVVTKDSVQQSNSTYAQGGIAGVMSPELQGSKVKEVRTWTSREVAHKALFRIIFCHMQVRAASEWLTATSQA